MKSKANSLTGAILNYIRMTGGHSERVNNIARQVTTKTGAKVFIPSANFKGTADIHACKKVQLVEAVGKSFVMGGYVYGQFVAIEVKIGKDKQSEAQAYYQECVEGAGGVYIIASDIDQFIREWEAI